MGTVTKRLKELESTPEYLAQSVVVDFTEEIERLMAERGMTHAELAAVLGKSQPYVTKVLRGDGNPTIKTLAEFASAFDLVVRVHLAPRDVSVRWLDEHQATPRAESPAAPAKRESSNRSQRRS